MRISVYLGGSGKKKSDIGVWFLDRDFLVNGEISAIWGRFQLIFYRTRNIFCETWYLPHSNMRNDQIIQIVPIARAILRIFTAHARNGYISVFDFRTFSGFQLIFSSVKQKVRHISTSGLFGLWRTSYAFDLESMPLVEPPTLIISTKFQVDTTIHRRVTVLLVRIRYVTFWPWRPFDLGQW